MSDGFDDEMDLDRTPHDDALENPGPDAIEISDDLLAKRYVLIRALDPNLHGVFGLLSFAILKTESVKKYELGEDDEMGLIGSPKPPIAVIKKIAPRFVTCEKSRRHTLRLEILAMNLIRDSQQKYESGLHEHRFHLPGIFFPQIKDQCWVEPETVAEKDKGMWFAAPYIVGPTVSRFITACRDRIPEANRTESRLANGVPRWVIPIILYQVIQAVAWLHKPPRGKDWMVAHRDLHTSNIMIDLSQSIPRGEKHPCNLWGVNTPMPRVIDVGKPTIRHIDRREVARYWNFDSRQWVLHESYNSGHRDPIARLETWYKDCRSIGYLVIALIFSVSSSKEVNRLMRVMNAHMNPEGALDEGMKEALENMDIGSDFWPDVYFQLRKQSHLDNALAIVAKWIEEFVDGNVGDEQVGDFKKIVEAAMPKGPSGDEIDEAIGAWQVELMKEDNERLLSGM